MPFAHADRVFTIIFSEDSSFFEVRAILDHLLDRNAFDAGVQESEGFYKIEVNETFFSVWVADMDVIIHRDS